MNWEEAKDQVVKEENYVTWDAFESVHFYGTIKWRECNLKAAELYARSMAAQAWEDACIAVEREAECLGTDYITPINPYKL